MKLTAFLSAMLFAVSLCTAAGAAGMQENGVTAAETAGEPAVTVPAEYEIPAPQPELYGFAPETAEIALEAGETFQLRVVWDADCYLAASLQFASDSGTSSQPAGRVLPESG